MQLAFYKGRTRLFNRFVCWWTAGPYSHVEAMFESCLFEHAQEHLCASSSFLDGGVRFKRIVLDPAKWDILDVPTLSGSQSRQWFNTHTGHPYDVLGLLSTSCPIRHSRLAWFCNEAIGASAGLQEAWRFNPNSFARLCESLPGARWIQGGMPADPSFSPVVLPYPPA